MTVVKIGVVGDGNGAFKTYQRGPIPTYGEEITINGIEYDVVDVKRFTTPKRGDAVRVDVSPTLDPSDEAIIVD